MRALGNHGVAELAGTPSLRVGGNDATHEGEADRFAAAMTAPASSPAARAMLETSRRTASTRRAPSTSPDPRPALGAGRALDAASRAYFEPRVGGDLGAVRVHTGPAAEESARALDARAYTIGRDIVFGAGAPAPHSRAGRELLAHEIGHVLQQTSTGAASHALSRAPADTIQRQPIGESKPLPESEQDPEEAAIVKTADRARAAPEDRASMTSRASSIGYRLVGTFIPEYAGLVSGVGYKATGATTAVKSGAKNVDITISKDFVLTLTSASFHAHVVALRDVLKATGVTPEPAGPRTGGMLATMIQAQRAIAKKEAAERAPAEKRHKEVQQRVVDLLTAYKTVPRGYTKADTLLQNSLELLDSGKVEMSILTPTHDADKRRTGKWAVFDRRVKHPNIGGTYDKSEDGLLFVDSTTLGRAFAFRPLGALTNTVASSLFVVVSGSDELSFEQLSGTIQHEMQHIVGRIEVPAPINSGTVFDAYRDEFNAYWIEQSLEERDCFTIPGTTGSCRPKNQSAIGSLTFSSGPKPGTHEFGQATGPVEQIEIDGKAIAGKCKTHCSGDVSDKKVTTKFANPRQRNIFKHLVQTYPEHGFDCYYLCSDFGSKADKLTGPAAENLVNSIRVEALIDAIADCKPEMAATDKPIERMKTAAAALDADDKGFLADAAKSEPFWTRASAKLPKTELDALKKLVKK